MYQENNEAVVPFKTEEFVKIINSAPAVLSSNQEMRDTIVKYSKDLVSKAQSNGMSDDLDLLMQKTQEKIRLRFKEMNEARKPITQLLGEVSKRFTTLESDIDPASKTNIFFQIQSKRNEWATKKMEEQKKKEAEAAAKIAKDKEAISIREQVNSAIGELISEVVLTGKSAAYTIFENLDLSTETTWEKQIKAIEENIAPHIYTDYIPPVFNLNHHTPSETIAIINEEKTQEKFELLQTTYKTELRAYKAELIDRLPSKLAELKEIEQAKISNAAEAQRLQAEADKRKKDEEARMQAEADEKAEKAREDAAVQSASQIAEATITHQADLFTEAPKVKESYEIIINNKAAYSLIFQFWFEKEGKSLTPEKIEKKSIAQMKKFCEDFATKNDEKINSPLISYKEIYKAK